MPHALIVGISGQDGAYLTRQLVSRGYEVSGTSRCVGAATLENLQKLGLHERVRLFSLNPQDGSAVCEALSALRPDHVYNLSGQSSVGLSFEKPIETFESIATATLCLLEAIKKSGQKIRFYNAGSAETFGDTADLVANELSTLRPGNPYSVAKAAAYWSAATYRKAYGMFVCTAILSNHESPLRRTRFVTSKIVDAAVRIANGYLEKLHLGNVDVARDWGWAEDFMDASVRMMERDEPADYVIATGETTTLKQFIEAAFSTVGLDWREWVTVDDNLKRPSDVARIQLDPSKAERELDWKAHYRMREVVRMMTGQVL